MAGPTCTPRTPEEEAAFMAAFDPTGVYQQKLREAKSDADQQRIRELEYRVKYLSDGFTSGASVVNTAEGPRVILRNGTYMTDADYQREAMNVTVQETAKIRTTGINVDGLKIERKKPSERRGRIQKAIGSAFEKIVIAGVKYQAAKRQPGDKDYLANRIESAKQFLSGNHAIAHLSFINKRFDNKLDILSNKWADQLATLFPPSMSKTDQKAWYHLMHAMRANGMDAIKAVEAVFGDDITSPYHIDKAEKSTLRMESIVRDTLAVATKLKELTDEVRFTLLMMGMPDVGSNVDELFVPQEMRGALFSEQNRRDANASIIHSGFDVGISEAIRGRFNPQYLSKWHIKNPANNTTNYRTAGKFEPAFLTFESEAEASAWVEKNGGKKGLHEIVPPASFKQLLSRGMLDHVSGQYAASFDANLQLATKVAKLGELAKYIVSSVDDGDDAVFSFDGKTGFVKIGEVLGKIDPATFNGTSQSTHIAAMFSGFVRKDVAEAIRGISMEHPIGSALRSVEAQLKANVTYRRVGRQVKQVPENLFLAYLDDPILGAKLSAKFVKTAFASSIDAITGTGSRVPWENEPLARMIKGDFKGIDKRELVWFQEFTRYGFPETSFVSAGYSTGLFGWSMADLANPKMFEGEGGHTMKEAAVGLSQTKAGRVVGGVEIAMKDLYQLSDLWFKYEAFKYHSKKSGSLDYAAERVLDTQFDFNNLPPRLKQVSGFVPFAALTGYNYGRIMRNHVMKYGDMHAVGSVAALAAMAGAGALGMAARDDEEEKEFVEMAGESAMPPYVLGIKMDNDGNYFGMDFSSFVPFADMFFGRSDPSKHAVIKALDAIGSVFPMTFRLFTDLIHNAYGTIDEGSVQDSPIVQNLKILDALARTMLPGYAYEDWARVIREQMVEDEENRKPLALSVFPVIKGKKYNIVDNVEREEKRLGRMEKGLIAGEEDENDSDFLNELQRMENEEAMESEASWNEYLGAEYLNEEEEE